MNSWCHALCHVPRRMFYHITWPIRDRSRSKLRFPLKTSPWRRMCPAGIDRRRSCATLFEDMCNEFRRVYIAASRIFRKPLRPFWMIVGSCWETDYETIKLYNVNKHMLYKCCRYAFLGRVQRYIYDFRQTILRLGHGIALRPLIRRDYR